MKQALLILLLTLPYIAFSEDGKTLHESQCIECHSRMTGGDGHVIYTRDDRIAKNLNELTSRVTHCSEGSNTGWSESEIKVVTQYLNNQYYNF